MGRFQKVFLKSPEPSDNSVVLDTEDQKLVERIKANDQQAFRRLYDKYKGPIMTYLNSIVRDQKTAEDLTQDVFLKVFRFAPSIDPKAKFAPWLWTVAKNAGLDRLRKKTELLSQSDDDYLVENLEDAAAHSDAELIESADYEAVRHCLTELSEPQREALTLRTVTDLSYLEIANQLGVSLSATKSLINRAKNAMVDCVGRRAK